MSRIFVSIECSAFSGATLLAFLLGAHPQIATVGEMDGLFPLENPDEYMCSCGRKIKACDFWQSVSAAMGQRGFEFDTAHFNTRFVLGGSPLIRRLRMGSFRNNTLDRLRDTILSLPPQEKARIDRLVSRNVAFVESVLEVTGKDIFVDTSKDFLRARYLRQFSDLDVRVIHLVRDVRGVAASRLRRNDRLSVETVGRQWVKENRRLQRTLKVFTEDKRMVVRYDDLCQDNRGSLARIYRFCGADPEVFVTDFRAVSHHIVGNVMRLNHSSEIRLDQRWKDLLTDEQLAQIGKLADGLSRQFGY